MNIDSELELQNGEVIGSRTSTNSMILVDYHYESPFFGKKLPMQTLINSF